MTKSSLKPLALCMMLLTVTPSMANQTWRINLKDADISALVAEMSEITGKNFVVDPRVKGTVTVVSNRALNKNEVYELFQSVLSINGFAAVPSGPVVKIVPDTNARQAGVRVDLSRSATGEQLVTRIVVLEQANAAELLAALRPMMPQSAHMAAVPGLNALVFSDRAANADSMQAIIRELDTGRADEAIEIVPVTNGRASDLLTVLESLELSPGGRGTQVVGRVRIVVDERTNRLIIRGDRSLRDRVRALVLSLDEAPDAGLDSVRVFRLKHANARQVAEVLRGVLSTGGTNSSSTSSSSSSSNPGAVNVTGNAGTNTSGARPGTGGTTTITVGSASLIADESQNALIVRATPGQIRQVETVLRELDVRRAQVLIQAAIVEVSGDNAAQLGVQWAVGDPSRGVGVINFNNAGPSLTNLAIAAVTERFDQAGIGNGAAIGLGRAGEDRNGNRTFVGALIQALNSVTDANLLSTPSIMTLDNQEAKIVVGQNVPFITGSTATVGSGVANPFTTIERQDVGITLKVTPTLSEGDTIRLVVEQEVSSVVPSAEGVNSADLITNKRAINTTILADDGQTIVLGGLVQDDVTKSVSRVPLLGDIPGLGILFRSTSEARTKRNLLVFLQPTVVRDARTAQALTERQYQSVRRVDLGVDAQGRLTRLPENIQDIYQGGRQRGVEAQAAPSRPTQLLSPEADVEVVPSVRPSATATPRATPAPSPAPVQAAPVAPTRFEEPQEPARVYAAELPAPIQARPVPGRPTPFTPTQITEADAAFAPLAPAPAPAPVVVQDPAPAPIPAPTPVTPKRDPAANPVVIPLNTRGSTRPEPTPRPYVPERATMPTPTEVGAREIRTRSGNVYQVPSSGTTVTLPAAATPPSAAPAAQPSPSGDAPRFREIRTRSGAVYRVPEVN